MESAKSPNIPVVDFASWETESSRLRIAREIVAACKQVGFVYIINHSLPESTLDEAFNWSKLFFNLPQDEKLKAPHPEGWEVHRGYSWPGLEKVSQAMSIDKDDKKADQLREVPDIKVRLRCVYP
ncbi:Oxoglutarate/iron-dependent dioxygenase [Penicillium coprophilum]|uniref:Oxoglutarate/iron-dependent dioxygenase n=1 Tax=Penicillium coprophilum TaxID=36646 RepID=UPI00238280E9|nr:Oxoglutarate/iron-dependent dioxygenase [Penicillium coprophilum]KAJ5169523.1 Oxoglutarate/iron-dependent dioxygenase [Penicillium coprophilum]